MDSARRIAENLHECSICFDSLRSKAVSGFVRHDMTKRSCGHLFHYSCICGLQSNICPLCNTEFYSIALVPNVLTRPEAWFRFIDVDNSESLSLQEIVDALQATLSLDWKLIEEDVTRLFGHWDVSNKGDLSMEDFLKPGGLLQYITSHLVPPESRPPPPDIRKKQEWFRYWDSDGSHSLDKSEICRAVVKTFRHMHNGLDDPAHNKNIASFLDMVWPIFDHDGSGAIELEEFVATDNLGDTILAELLFNSSCNNNTTTPRRK